MKAEIWAGLLHNMSSDDNPLHTRCSPSWCWYRRAEENGETPESHKHHTKNFLSREVGKKLIPGVPTECPVTVCYSACSMEGLKMQMSASTLSYGPDVQKQYLWGKAELRLQPSTRVKRRRQSVSTAKKVKRHRQEIEEGPTYGAGMDI
ncbi:hypothetical protein QQF64_035929 [Cirrhinus molitorella]|uniref:Uncharacterized protein n=1 Tax=Cirrhinus molitorella TaxID=172907 RepID=A0ABR3NHW5_9TELE